MNHLPDRLREFTAWHDAMIRRMTSARSSADLGSLEATIHETYHSTLGLSSREKPMSFDRQQGYDPMAGMRQMLASGHTSRAENRTVRLRGENEAVVFFEHVLMKDGQDVARTFFVQTFCRMDGEWKLMRETMEAAAV